MHVDIYFSTQGLEPHLMPIPYRQRYYLAMLYSTAQKLVTSRVSFPAQQESCRAVHDSHNIRGELHSARNIEEAIFGINYSQHVQRETNLHLVF